MSKHQVVFLVHGMGNHSPTPRDETPKTGWTKEPINALNSAAGHFKKIGKNRLDHFLEFVPITYDQVFHHIAATQATQIDLMKDVLGGDFAMVENWIDGQPSDDLNFFWTHIADVLLYRFSQDVRDSVHTHFNTVFTEGVEKAWDEHGAGNVKFHVMAHSLGTAVANGALTRLATIPHAGGSEYLHGTFQAISNHFAIANVSRVVWAGKSELFYNDVGLRPHTAGRGYVDYFLNVRHTADPFVAAMRFDPPDWGNQYKEIKVRHVHEINVHGWGHYLSNPRVSVPILSQILGEDIITPEESRALRKAWDDMPKTMSAENKQKIFDAVSGVETHYQKTFGREGNLIADAATAILKSVDELLSVLKIMKGLGI